MKEKVNLLLLSNSFVDRKQLWQNLHFEVSLTAADGDVLKGDLLKLFVLSPLLKKIVKSFHVPSALMHILDVNILLPDFSPDAIGMFIEYIEHGVLHEPNNRELL